MAGVSNEAILLKADSQFKGPLTENYVLQQIKNIYDTEPKYFAPTATSKIDFIVQNGMSIIPIEFKGGESTSSASFKEFIKKFNLKKAVRISKLGYDCNDNFSNLPVYLANKIKEII